MSIFRFSDRIGDVQNTTTVGVNLTSEEGQLLILAMAELGIARPGWNDALLLIADKLKCRDMYEKFQQTNRDKFPIEPTDENLGIYKRQRRNL